MNYFIMIVKTYKDGWLVPRSEFDFSLLAEPRNGYSRPGRGGTFYNTYTLNVENGDSFDLLYEVNALVAAEQCVLSLHSKIERVIVIEHGDDELSADSVARVFWVHNWPAAGSDYAQGLHGFGALDRFIALRVNTARLLNAPTRRLYYDAICEDDAEWSELEYNRGGGIGLRTDGSLGDTYFSAHSYFMRQAAHLETSVSIDRDGRALDLYPVSGEPVMALATIEVKARQRHTAHTADDEMFDMLTHEMLTVVLVALSQYERGYIGFHFLWGSNEIPNYNPYQFEYANWDAAALAQRQEALLPGTIATRLQFNPRVSPRFLYQLFHAKHLWETWKTLVFSVPTRVSYLGNTDIAAGLAEKIDSQLEYADHVRTTFFNNFLQFFHGTEWSSAFFLRAGEVATFWYDEWPRIEQMIFELQRCFALLQTISYIRYRRTNTKGETVQIAPQWAGDTGELGKRQWESFWESAPIGRGPFLNVRDDLMGGNAAVFLGPSKPDWNPTTEPVSWVSLYLLDLQLTWLVATAEYDAALIIFHEEKTLYQIADPAQQSFIAASLNRALYPLWGGIDPDPDTEPSAW